MRVLVAEDDVANRKFLVKLLERYGEVTVVEDGMSAVDAFAKAVKDEILFDLVCMDIMMPKIDGYKALEALREAERKLGVVADKRTKVIMISALDEVGLATDHICSDYDAYICKPIDIDKFLELIRKLGIQV